MSTSFRIFILCLKKSCSPDIAEKIEYGPSSKKSKITKNSGRETLKKCMVPKRIKVLPSHTLSVNYTLNARFTNKINLIRR